MNKREIVQSENYSNGSLKSERVEKSTGNKYNENVWSGRKRLQIDVGVFNIAVDVRFTIIFSLFVVAVMIRA